MTEPPSRMPVGKWVRVEIPDPGTSVVAFTYLDPTAGLSAQGGEVKGDELDTTSRMIVRLPIATPWRLLSADEVRGYGLDDPPGWVAEFYGPQPPAGTIWGEWQDHPKLAGRFLPEFPDDLQVLVHDGGPRLTDRRPELIWVRVVGMHGDVFSGVVLNRPHQLRTVQEGQRIRFVVPDGGEHPLMVTDKYLRERPDWVVQPCAKCGMSELFDAPSDLIRATFNAPAAGAQMMGFTARCGNCGGFQLVRNAAMPPLDAMPAPDLSGGRPAAPVKKWWQFWK